MCARTLTIGLGLVIMTTSGWAQSPPVPAPSREETFRQIGRSLEGIENSLHSSNPTKMPTGTGETSPAIAGAKPVIDWNNLTSAAGSTFTASVTVNGLSGPNPTAAAAGALTPGTRVQFQGVENGFVRIAPIEGPSIGTTMWVPLGAAKATLVTAYVDTKISEAMDRVSKLATAIENNPYVRLKGFKLNISFSPSIDVEFEMKGGADSSEGTLAKPKP